MVPDKIFKDEFSKFFEEIENNPLKRSMINYFKKTDPVEAWAIHTYWEE